MKYVDLQFLLDNKFELDEYHSSSKRYERNYYGCCDCVVDLDTHNRVRNGLLVIRDAENGITLKLRSFIQKISIDDFNKFIDVNEKHLPSFIVENDLTKTSTDIWDNRD